MSSSVSVSVRKVRVAVIVFNADGQLLLCRQNNRPFWVLPGGTLEPNESVLDCARRELLEETGLRIRVEHIVGIADFLRPQSPQALDITCYATLQSASEQEDLVMQDDENLNEIGFFSKEALNTLDIKPDYVTPLILKHWQDRAFPDCPYFESGS
jgi:8-oxo-dGTP diphosphatase